MLRRGGVFPGSRPLVLVGKIGEELRRLLLSQSCGKVLGLDRAGGADGLHQCAEFGVEGEGEGVVDLGDGGGRRDLHQGDEPNRVALSEVLSGVVLQSITPANRFQ